MADKHEHAALRPGAGVIFERGADDPVAGGGRLDLARLARAAFGAYRVARTDGAGAGDGADDGPRRGDGYHVTRTDGVLGEADGRAAVGVRRFDGSARTAGVEFEELALEDVLGRLEVEEAILAVMLNDLVRICCESDTLITYAGRDGVAYNSLREYCCWN